MNNENKKSTSTRFTIGNLTEAILRYLNPNISDRSVKIICKDVTGNIGIHEMASHKLVTNKDDYEDLDISIAVESEALDKESREVSFIQGMSKYEVYSKILNYSSIKDEFLVIRKSANPKSVNKFDKSGLTEDIQEFIDESIEEDFTYDIISSMKKPEILKTIDNLSNLSFERK